jgi:hypothetical protein
MKTLGQLASHFGQLAAGAYKQNLSPILDLIGQAVKTEVQKEIGEYQGAISPFPRTAPLAQATLDRKADNNWGKGGNPDTPLWATGDYHNSIGVAKDVNSLSVEIGSNTPYVKYHELGTGEMPQRPIFGPATLRAIPPLLPAISDAAGLGIIGGAWKGLSAEGITHTPDGPSANILPDF